MFIMTPLSIISAFHAIKQKTSKRKTASYLLKSFMQ